MPSLRRRQTHDPTPAPPLLQTMVQTALPAAMLGSVGVLGLFVGWMALTKTDKQQQEASKKQEGVVVDMQSLEVHTLGALDTSQSEAIVHTMDMAQFMKMHEAELRREWGKVVDADTSVKARSFEEMRTLVEDCSGLWQGRETLADGIQEIMDLMKSVDDRRQG